ncbi:unnamed protein product [Colias eurytheme]|nr:unnamed protein product [Colias eurytheme]
MMKYDNTYIKLDGRFRNSVGSTALNMPFDFIGFFGPSRDVYRGRSSDGPAFGHPDDCPEEYGVPQRSTSWWGRWSGPPFNGREGFSGPPFRSEDWRGPPMRRHNDQESCDNMRPEGWRGPPWWCWRNGPNAETGEHSRPDGCRGPWTRNHDPGNFYSETGERPESRCPPWMWNRGNGPYGSDCDRPSHEGHRREGWWIPPWLWNRDGRSGDSADRSRSDGWRGPPLWREAGNFSAETGERSRPDGWRAPPWWLFARGDFPGNEGWRRPSWWNNEDRNNS